MSRTHEMKVRWFLHQTHEGAKGIVHSNLQNKVGTLVAHNWPVYDKHSPGRKVIAHAQGLNILAGMSTPQHWHNSFSIVFVDSTYKGSTLQVMGMGGNGCEWAIVGGTGVFSCAQGVIHKKLVETRSDGNIVGLDIHFFYTPM